VNDIYRQIMEAVADYECNTGRKPKRVYLGLDTLDELRQEMQPLLYRAFDRDPDWPTGVVAQFAGLNVYVIMDDKLHIQVA
jgi:hypothetical protein